jgi:ABC-2 type transport system permease protein
MVRILIALRAAITRNQLARSSQWALWGAVAFGLLSAGGTLALGVVHGPQVSGLEVDGSVDRVSAVLLLWLGGQLAQTALNGGDAALKPELLALLPLGRRRLAWALLVVGLCDPALVIVAVAYGALIAVAAGLGAAAVIAAVVGLAGLLLLTSVAATLAGGTLGPGARRGRDLGTIVTALAISFLAVAATLLPRVLSALQAGHWGGLAVVLRALPSGWPGDAVDAARDGRWWLAAVTLLAPFALAAVLAEVWPSVLARRMTGTAGSVHRAGRHQSRRLLPATPAGAVAGKEIRLWLRDPVRVTCLLIGLIVGVGAALIPRLVAGHSELLPFSGPLTVIIAGACAINLYGNDGSSLWLTVVTPRAAAADIRGRQLAWLLVVAPFAVIETVLLTAWSGQHALWPWAVGLLIALLGGAAGLAPLGSLISVQPLDDSGNPTPAWSLKVHVALYLVTLTAAPAGAVLLAGTLTHDTAVSWLGVAVAVVTASAFAVLLGRAAGRRLRAQQVSILRLLAG